MLYAQEMIITDILSNFNLIKCVAIKVKTTKNPSIKWIQIV